MALDVSKFIKAPEYDIKIITPGTCSRPVHVKRTVLVMNAWSCLP